MLLTTYVTQLQKVYLEKSDCLYYIKLTFPALVNKNHTEECNKHITY